MRSWVVLEAPRGAAVAPGEELMLTRDGFSFLAFLFPPLWLLWHRLWIEAIAVFAVLLVAAALENVVGLSVSAPLSVLVSIFVGLEGNAMRIARWRRRGWSMIGVVDAHDASDAETRFAEADEIDEEWHPQDRTEMLPSASGAASAAAPSPGLLLNPGR